MTIDLFMGFLKLLFTIGVIFGIFFYLNKVLKKTEKSRKSEYGMIQVIDRMRITMKDEVILTKIGKEYLLYSTSSGNFTLLSQSEIKPNTEEFAAFYESRDPKQMFHSVMSKVNDKLVKK